MTCTLHHVLDGVEAVDFLRKASTSDPENFPCTIFLDLKMPLLNGFEVLEWIKAQPFARSIQVIVLSGSEQEQDKQRASKLGAREYIVKPVRVTHLRRILEPVCPPQMGAHV